MSAAPRTAAVTLQELVDRSIATELHGDGATEVRGVQHDSRAVQSGELFVAISGERFDGSQFVSDAVSRGAVAVLAERQLQCAVPQLVAPDARRALALAAAHVYGDPTGELEVVGITGTNGKTTTAWLTEAALASSGASTAVMGTVAFRGPGIDEEPAFTTPEGDDFARFARRVLDAGASHLVMEVSSHGLALHRVDGVHFGVAAFTNLTQDHLDFHGTFERYAEAKARLFTDLRPRAAVINVDDPFGAQLAQRTDAPVWRCSASPAVDADIRALEYTAGRDGVRAHVQTPAGARWVRTPLLGAHNLDNLLVALGCGLALGRDLDGLVRGLERSSGAPGRLEPIAHPGDVAVLVDYAHTSDALARVLDALRPITPGRLIVLFGCGGDRDRAKRPLMGEAAARRADVCIVTSDNPRTEDPDRIIEAIVPGVEGAGMQPIPTALRTATRGYVTITERRHAIREAIGAARPGDTVLLAGRGHEPYQTVGTDKLPLDDRDEARVAIEQETARSARGAGEGKS